MPWVAAVAMLAGSAIQAMGANKAKKAAENLSYTPIDIDKVKADAAAQAQQNIKNSLALEATYAPGLAKARAELQRQVASDLAQGGNLPVDVANRVTRSAMAQSGGAGFGTAGPATAATLGLTAYDVRNQNQAKAAQLLAENPLPESGLSPSAIANLEIAKTNTKNQFDMSRAGAISNANQSMYNAIGSGISAAGSAYGYYSALDRDPVPKDPPPSNIGGGGPSFGDHGGGGTGNRDSWLTKTWTGSLSGDANNGADAGGSNIGKDHNQNTNNWLIRDWSKMKW